MARIFLSVCLALASSTGNAVVNLNAIEFGRLASPRSPALKRHEVFVKTDLHKPHGGGVLRRKDHSIADFDDTSMDELA